MQWFTITLLLACTVLAANAYSKADEKNEQQNTINCKSVCGDCNCRGFYCGEECICECDNDSEEDVRCLMTMHKKCKKLQFPFEVLIQGPSGNRFIRNALLFEELYQQCLKHDVRNRRNTIFLYKPELQPRKKRQTDEVVESEPEVVEAEPEVIVGAPHTAVDPLDTPTVDLVPAPQETVDTNVDAPTVGLPLALALPAVRAKTRLTASTIRAQYEASLARIRARLAARRPLLLGAAAAGLVDGVPGPHLAPLPPPLPVQPLFTL